MMIIFSDLHLTEDSADVVFREVLPGIERYANDNGVKTIACLGDVFSIRYRVSVALQLKLREVFHRWVCQGIDLLIVPGNHDQIDVEGRNALTVYGDLPKVRVFNAPTRAEYLPGHWGLFVPYRSKYGESQLPSESTPTLFGHFGVQGAWMNDTFQNSNGVPASRLAGFRHVFLGHYHKRQEITPRIRYVGSPYQVTASEAGQPKGFMTFDGETARYVDTVWGPRYHMFKMGAGDRLDLSVFNPRDEIRITTAPGVDPQIVAEQLSSAGFKRHVVTPTVVHQEQRLDVPRDAPLQSFAETYVSEFATGVVTKEAALGMFEQIKNRGV